MKTPREIGEEVARLPAMLASPERSAVVNTTAAAIRAERKGCLHLTKAEAELLWLVISNGAGDDSLTFLGLGKAEMNKFSRWANRFADQFKLGGPRFGEVP